MIKFEDLELISLAARPIALALSYDLRYLAVSLDSKRFVVKDSNRAWKNVRAFTSSEEISAICWHPSRTDLLAFGDKKGTLTIVSVAQKEFKDFCFHWDLGGPISHIAFKTEELAAVIAHGNTVSLLELPTLYRRNADTSIWTILTLQRRVSTMKVAFLDPCERTILVAFGRTIKAFNLDTHPPKRIWSMEMETAGCSFAVSPSLKQLAVLNTRCVHLFLVHPTDNVRDPMRKFAISESPAWTIKYSDIRGLPNGSLLGIAFVEDNLVVCGHTSGHIALLRFGKKNGYPSVRSLHSGGKNVMSTNLQLMDCKRISSKAPLHEYEGVLVVHERGKSTIILVPILSPKSQDLSQDLSISQRLRHSLSTFVSVTFLLVAACLVHDTTTSLLPLSSAANQRVFGCACRRGFAIAHAFALFSGRVLAWLWRSLLSVLAHF
ncbi:hypothetical protein CC2G_004354 [Coprinopsis cinerea AmutBmut pab1-1]|nr:hypothetical protein CC2G_004354 [Coprinopsis cinerea AmutBmut pab1-1]